MPRPQQPELRRSGKTPEMNRDEVEGELEARDRPDVDSSGSPVPPENQPGPKDQADQDKPQPGERPG